MSIDIFIIYPSISNTIYHFHVFFFVVNCRGFYNQNIAVNCSRLSIVLCNFFPPVSFISLTRILCCWNPANNEKNSIVTCQVSIIFDNVVSFECDHINVLRSSRLLNKKSSTRSDHSMMTYFWTQARYQTWVDDTLVTLDNSINCKKSQKYE